MCWRWDTIKDKAKRILTGGDFLGVVFRLGPYACLASIDNGTRWQTNMEELEARVRSHIDRWDIRRAKALLDLCPGIVPTRLAGRTPMCYADPLTNEWMLEL